MEILAGYDTWLEDPYQREALSDERLEEIDAVMWDMEESKGENYE